MAREIAWEGRWKSSSTATSLYQGAVDVMGVVIAIDNDGNNAVTVSGAGDDAIIEPNCSLVVVGRNNDIKINSTDDSYGRFTVLKAGLVQLD